MTSPQSLAGEAPIYDLRGVAYDTSWLVHAADQTCALGDGFSVETLSAGREDAENQQPDVSSLHARMKINLHAEGRQPTHPTVGEADFDDC